MNEESQLETTCRLNWSRLNQICDHHITNNDTRSKQRRNGRDSVFRPLRLNILLLPLLSGIRLYERQDCILLRVRGISRMISGRVSWLHRWEGDCC